MARSEGRVAALFLEVVSSSAEFREGVNSTEADTKRQRRSRSAIISRRLVTLARSASASIDFSGQDHSRALLEQAFDDGRCCLE